MIKQRLLHLLPRHRDSRLLRRLDRMCVRFHEAFENLDYDFRSNGENFVLETLARQPGVETILDVGANVGEWSAMAARSIPGATIHSFELVPETRERLRATCAPYPNVHAQPFGLSEAPGEVDVYYSPEMNANATCVNGISELFHKIHPPALKAAVTTGDLFCEKTGIGRIDFLKMDVEGFEPQVLRGFRARLEAGDIRMIQFEYGYVNIVVRFLLKDFYDFLAPYGMKIGKIYPDRVEFRDYDLHDENFLGPNYLAVHESMRPLLRELAGPGRWP